MKNCLLSFLEHPDSGAQVFKTLEAIEKERNSRPAPAKGFAYKRDFVDNAMSEGYNNLSFIQTHLEPVILGTSRLTLSQRKYVKYVVNRACDDFYTSKKLKSRANKIFYAVKSILKPIK